MVVITSSRTNTYLSPPNQNIFVHDGHVFLGDFGLTKSLGDKVIPPTASKQMLRELASGKTPPLNLDDTCNLFGAGNESVDMGTFLYTDPEIKNRSSFSAKADFYSLGIIFVELFQPFSTAMERAVVLSDVREKRQLPAEMERRYPAESAFARRLLATNPELRPSGREVLDDPIFACLFPHQSSSIASSPRSSVSGFAKPIDGGSTVSHRGIETTTGVGDQPTMVNAHQNDQQKQQPDTQHYESERVRFLEDTVLALMKQVQELQEKLAEKEQRRVSESATLTHVHTAVAVTPPSAVATSPLTPRAIRSPSLASSAMLSSAEVRERAAILRPGQR